jgi:hypothetical protein
VLKAAHTILQRRILITGNQWLREDLKGSGHDTISRAAPELPTDRENQTSLPPGTDLKLVSRVKETRALTA